MSIILEESKRIKESDSKLDKIFSMLNLLKHEPDNIYESVIIKNTIRDNIQQMKDETGGYFDKLNDIPYFNPTELEDYKNRYSKSEIRFLDEDNTISSKKWLDSCALLFNGIISEKHQEYTALWVKKIQELYNEMNKSNNIERINEIKQNILDLAWNPECEFTLENRIKNTQLKRDMIRQKYNNQVYDIQEFVQNINNTEDYISESSLYENPDKFPLYIVLTYTGTGFGKLINKFTHGIYSHAAISLDDDMSRLYSFNLKDNGFSLESIDRYLKDNKESTMVIYTIFINRKDLLTVKTKLDYFLLNKRRTKYSLFNILGVLVNKPVEMANDMICSQFVDYILKSIDIDITNKHSGLVTPNDLYMALNPNIYKLYEGKIIDYDYKKLEKLTDALIKKTKTITESMTNIIDESSYLKQLYLNKDNITNILALDEKCEIVSEENKEIYDYLKPYIDIDYIKEAKEFPVQFDEDGNLLIKRIQMIDYDHEFSKSHKLLKLYENSDNLEGMKYELSKLWFLNNLLEKKIYSESDNKKKNEYHKSRARILNDFTKYSKLVNSKDSEFNFTDYYNNSPFSDATIKINNSTLRHGVELIKNISKIFIH